jgi:predicted flap endonuclease-1-like 5' DNA nuclease
MAIKGGLMLMQRLQQLVTATNAGWSDLIAEARRLTSPVPAESRVPQAPPQLAATTWQPAADTDTALGEVVAEQPQPAEETDLLRLTGIGRRFAALLCAAGVESIRVLARRNPSNLHERLMQVNAEQPIVSQAPSLEQVTAWITQAQQAAI